MSHSIKKILALDTAFQAEKKQLLAAHAATLEKKKARLVEKVAAVREEKVLFLQKNKQTASTLLNTVDADSAAAQKQVEAVFKKNTQNVSKYITNLLTDKK